MERRGVGGDGPAPSTSTAARPAASADTDPPESCSAPGGKRARNADGIRFKRLREKVPADTVKEYLFQRDSPLAFVDLTSVLQQGLAQGLLHDKEKAALERFLPQVDRVGDNSIATAVESNTQLRECVSLYQWMLRCGAFDEDMSDTILMIKGKMRRAGESWKIQHYDQFWGDIKRDVSLRAQYAVVRNAAGDANLTNRASRPSNGVAAAPDKAVPPTDDIEASPSCSINGGTRGVSESHRSSLLVEEKASTVAVKRSAQDSLTRPTAKRGRRESKTSAPVGAAPLPESDTSLELHAHTKRALPSKSPLGSGVREALASTRTIKEAAAAVLRAHGAPMRAKDIVETAIAKGLYATKSRTPINSFVGMVSTERKRLGEGSVFVVTAPSTYGLREWGGTTG